MATPHPAPTEAPPAAVIATPEHDAPADDYAAHLQRVLAAFPPLPDQLRDEIATTLVSATTCSADQSAA